MKCGQMEEYNRVGESVILPSLFYLLHLLNSLSILHDILKSSFINLFIMVYFGDKVSLCISERLETHAVAQDGLKLSILLS